VVAEPERIDPSKKDSPQGAEQAALYGFRPVDPIGLHGGVADEELYRFRRLAHHRSESVGSPES